MQNIKGQIASIKRKKTTPKPIKENVSVIPSRFMHSIPGFASVNLSVGRLKETNNFLPIQLAQCSAAVMPKETKSPKCQNANPSDRQRQLTIPQEKKTKKWREEKWSEKTRRSSMTLPYNSPSEESLGIITTSSPNSGRKLAQYSWLALYREDAAGAKTVGAAVAGAVVAGAVVAEAVLATSVVATAVLPAADPPISLA
jgi:hypothetical protein